VSQADPLIGQQLEAGQIDWITVTSSAIARSLVALFGADLAQARLASISPLTSAVLAELGHPASVEAVVYTMEGLLEAIEQQGPPPLDDAR
jgi:uroporphyrinogen III methyltransferase/synthase